MKKELKKLLVFLLLVVFLVSSLAIPILSIEDWPPEGFNGPSQIIMRLSSETNAHGELAYYETDDPHPIDINYEDKFGEDYEGENPYQCIGSNRILGLSSETNAHAESPSSYFYDNDICYGNLQCQVRDSCKDEEEFVVALSRNHNAHLNEEQESGYYNVCCSVGAVSDPAYDLTIGIEGEGETTPSEGTHTYNEGLTVKVSEESEDGWRLDKFEGDCKGKICILDMNRNRNVKTIFVPEEEDDKTLKVDIDGVGSSNPPEGTHIYSDGEEVEFTDITPGDGWKFVEFEGDCEGQSCTLDMDENKEVILIFEEEVLPTGDAYWADMNDDPIEEASVEQGVKLIVDYAPFEGENIEFTIYKEGVVGDKEIDDKQSDDGFVTWKAGKENGDFEEGDYYFEAESTDGNKIDSSDYENYGVLSVSEPEIVYPVDVEISSPSDGDKFRKEGEIEFEANIESEGSDVRIKWDFGDGNEIIRKNCMTTGDCNVSHSYDSAGGFNVIAKVEEMGRESPQKDSDYIAISVYKKDLSIVPEITLPEPDKVIYGTGFVDFDVSNSYVANCTSLGSCTVPSDTPGGGTEINVDDCYTVDDSDLGDLKCFKYPKDWIGEDGGYDLWFKWEFSDNEKREGNWTGNYDEVVEFERYFGTSGRHWSKLKMGYEKK